MAAGFVARLFGKKKDEDVSPEQAIQKLQDIEEVLQKKSAHLEQKIEQETEKAKKAGLKNKRVAIKALKAKKKFEKELNETDNTLSTIELQREDLESIGTTTAVFKALSAARSALSKANMKLDVEGIHTLMEDIEEQREQTREIREALSMRLQDDDDEELEEELKLMMEEDEENDLTEELTKLGPITGQLPDVPVDEPITNPRPISDNKKKKEIKKRTDLEEDEDGLRELAAWAN